MFSWITWSMNSLDYYIMFWVVFFLFIRLVFIWVLGLIEWQFFRIWLFKMTDYGVLIAWQLFDLLFNCILYDYMNDYWLFGYWLVNCLIVWSLTIWLSIWLIWPSQLNWLVDYTILTAWIINRYLTVLLYWLWLIINCLIKLF